MMEEVDKFKIIILKILEIKWKEVMMEKKRKQEGW